MKLSLYQIDAFTDTLFGGNPAAVVPLRKWIDEKLMQQLGMENNLAETVFFVPSDTKHVDYDIRWFTPAVEINLCGHATLASAYVLFNILKEKKKKIVFSSKSGLLTVTRKKDLIQLDFPSWKPEPLPEAPPAVIKALGNIPIISAHKHRDLLIELENEDAVLNCRPDFTALKSTGEKVIITAPGKEADFVSRFFAPAAGIDEDPVTGSAHSQLIPFWSERLKKDILHAKQLSQRTGTILCRQLNKDRVMIAGKCVYYMKGEFKI